MTERGSERGPPQRDKEEDKKKFNIKASLQEQAQLKVLAMLEANNDRFAFSMKDLEPSKFIGEPMRLDLDTYKPIFRPPHKLGQVELDFVEAQCAKLEGLGFIKRSTRSLYASTTVVVTGSLRWGTTQTPSV